MEEENVVVSSGGRMGRLLLKSSSIGAVAAVIGWGASGPLFSAGLFVGALAAAIYAWGYVSSHLSRAGREKFYDSSIARGALLRMALIGLAGAGTYQLGRLTFVGFLVGFAVSFALLLVSEMGHIKKELRARGLIGGSV